LDISFNNYSIEAIQNLFEGLIVNKTLKNLEMTGMPIAQINIHKFCEGLKENSTLERISWDMEIDDQDLDLFEKLEKMTLINFSLRSIKTSKTEISLKNNLSSLLFLYLQSNQWIHENIKHINNSGIPPCPVKNLIFFYKKILSKEKKNFLNLELFITCIERKTELFTEQ